LVVVVWWMCETRHGKRFTGNQVKGQAQAQRDLEPCA
jgi:hypothetical protein